MLTALAVGSAAAAQEAPYRFVFDDGFSATGCLGFTLDRPTSTIGHDGRAIGPDEARFGRTGAIAGAPVFEQVRAPGGIVQVHTSGFGRDGVTPMMVIWEPKGGYLDVFTVTGAAFLEAEASGQGRVRTALDPAAPDLMFGAVEGKRYAPVTASVCHGAVVLFCRVQTPNNYGQWRDSAVGFFASVDEGQTWDLIFEDTPIQVGLTRSREWAMQNWWPMTHGAAPTEAFIAAADYRANPGSTGGRVYLMRLTRPDTEAPWTIEPPRVVYEQSGVPKEHFHTAAVVPLDGGGLRTVVAVGDSQEINRIVSLTREDHAWDDLTGWTIDETYHGSRGEQGLAGNQFVGAAPAPRLGDVIIGADLNDEQIMLLTADGKGDHPKTSWLYGRNWVDGRGSANFTILTPRPETGKGPWISRHDPHQANADELMHPRRAILSLDGRHWAQVLAPGTRSSWTVVLHGEHIYVGRGTGVLAGMVRTPIPPVRLQRPLLVGPGGVQRLVPDPEVVSVPGGIEALERSPEGLWLDGGVPLDPQPPCGGAVYRCRSSEFDPDNRIGEIMIGGAAADVGDVLGTDWVRVRVWVRSLSDENTVHPRFYVGSNIKPHKTEHTTSLCTTGSWMSVDILGESPVAPGETGMLSVKSGNIVDRSDFYLAVESLGEGIGFPGYPMMPDETSPPVGTVAPDELASVGGFDCGSAWTITLAGLLPQDGWDQSMTQVTSWPLCTLWGDADNYIELSADTEAGWLVARIVRDGKQAGTIRSSTLFWLRGSPVLVSLADDGTGVRMTVSAAGLPVHEAEIVNELSSPAVAPTRIMFGDATGLSGDGAAIRVSPMEWFGGRIDAGAALDEAARRELLTSLSFLDPIPPDAADLDGDGQRTIFDFLLFQNLFLAQDPVADFDGDGDFDLFDFLAYQNAFVSPCW
jgi:hypothetical protein